MTATLETIAVAPLGIMEAERELLRPRPRRNVVQWAAEDRRLPELTSSMPGPFSWEICPFLVEPALMWTVPGTRQVTARKCAQSGWTELGLNILGRTIAEDPAPSMVVMPTEHDAKRRIRARIRPMFDASADLAAHLPGGIEDLNAGQETILDNMIVYLAWSNSAAALADNPVALVILDEVGKYPLLVGSEGDPVSLAAKRQTTFPNARTLVGSTPTSESDLITREFEAGDRRQYHVRCPHCGIWQRVEFDGRAGRVIMDKAGDGQFLPPSAYLAGGRARYVCGACKAVWSESDRWTAILAGIWVPAGCELVDLDAGGDPGAPGHREPAYGASTLLAHALDGGDYPPPAPDAWLTGEKPPPGHCSYQISGLMLHPAFGMLDKMAGEWATADKASKSGDLGPLIDFVNSRQGREWEQREATTNEDKLAKHVEAYPPNMVPSGAVVLTAGIDVQADHFFVTIWAWAYLFEAWLVRAERIDAGPTDDLGNWRPVADLLAMQFESAAAADGGGKNAPPAQMPIKLALIDSGYRPHQVYDFCRTFAAGDVRPTKGHDRLDAVYKPTRVDYSPLTGKVAARSVRLWHVDVTTFKDRLANQAARSHPGPGYLHLPADTTADFLRQFCAEEKKVIPPKSKTAKPRKLWVTRRDHPDNHYWDCSVLALVAAVMGRVGDIRPPGAPPARRPGRRMGTIAGPGRR